MSQRRTPKDRIPPALRWQVWERDDFRCHYCGKRKHLAVDHKVPESKGGKTEAENLVTACALCNSRKGDRDYDFFRFLCGIEPAARETARFTEILESGERSWYSKTLDELTADEALCYITDMMFKHHGKKISHHCEFLFGEFGDELKELQAAWYDGSTISRKDNKLLYIGITERDPSGNCVRVFRRRDTLSVGDWIQAVRQAKERRARIRLGRLVAMAIEDFGEPIRDLLPLR